MNKYYVSKQQRKYIYESLPYGAFYTKEGEKVLFNRAYQPLDDEDRWVENIEFTEWYYIDTTPMWERKEIGEKIMGSGEQPYVPNLVHTTGDPMFAIKHELKTKAL